MASGTHADPLRRDAGEMAQWSSRRTQPPISPGNGKIRDRRDVLVAKQDAQRHEGR